ncbi:MAG: hypothetical protein WKF46_09955 [Candidatus Limnocylindrales bacterium]
MTTTYQPGGGLAAPNEVRSRRGPAAALAGGSLLAAAALSMHLRGGVVNVEFVHRVEDAPDLWLTAHALMAVGGILLVLGLIAVPGLAHGRGHRAVAVGAGLAAVGAASTALGDFAHGSLAYLLAGEVSAEESLQIQERFFSQPVLAAVSMPGLLLPLGMLVLGGGLLYSRAVPAPAALLLLVAPITVQLGYMMTDLPMPVMVLPVVTGLGWISLVLARKPREDPASG